MSFALVPELNVTETQHGMVLLDERNGRYWMVNATGAMVLRRLLSGDTVDDAVADLRERFPSAADAAEADVRNLLGALREAKVTTS